MNTQFSGLFPPVSWQTFMKQIMVCLILQLAITTTYGSGIQLIDVIKAGDAKTANQLLRQNVNVNAQQADGATALHWAVHRDDIQLAELLVRSGANVNAADEGGVTPLWLATQNGNSEIAMRLLKAGAKPDMPLRNGETPLMTAAEIGNLDIVKALLTAGADVNVKEVHGGQTALMWAIAEGHTDIVQALIEHGANIRDRTKGGFTPLLFASLNDSRGAVEALLSMDADVNETSPDNLTPLLLAAASGHDKLTQYLLEQGADPTDTDFKGFTALHYAAMQRHMLDSVRSLLAKGADPNAQIVKPSARHELVNIPDIPFLDLPARIVAAGTKGGTFPVGATPIYLAAQQRNAPAMHLLAENGADLDLGTTETVYYLGSSGRRVNFIAKTTPLMAAAGMDRVEANWNEYPQASRKQALDAVKVAIEMGADVNAANEYGLTALHAAAFIAADDIVEVLVNSGANLNAMDRYGQTPLSISRFVITTHVGNNFDIRPRRYDPTTSSLLVKLGATPLEDSGVQILEELSQYTQ